MAMNRRTFLGLGAGAAATGTGAWVALVRDRADHSTGRTGGTKGSDGTEPAAKSGAASASRVLVVLQLSGGNDGLNTVVPVTGRYHDLRPTLGVADDDLVALRGLPDYGLHPSLAPLADLWAAEHLALVSGIGYPDNSRSHFAALDSWWTATPGKTSTTGWLGRWLDATVPDGAPDPLRAVTIGRGSPALRAERSPSTAIIDPSGFALATPRGVDADALVAAFLKCATPATGKDLRTAAQRSVSATLDVLDRVTKTDLATMGPEFEPPDPAAGEAGGTMGEYVAGDVTAGLSAAANLIGHDLGTQVILVDAGGFDTHANQADTHKRLLADVGQGVAGFQEAITASGHADDVLLISTSEFGRRAAENGSGTDHGNGGTSFVVGTGVRGSLVGTPDLARLDDQGDVASSIDVRSLYATALTWLGGPVDDVLGRAYDTHDLLR